MGTYIAIDTNIFGDTFLQSSRIRTLIELSKKAQVRLSIPAAVGIEVSARFKEELAAAVDGYRGAREKLRKVSIDLGALDPSHVEQEARFKSALEKFIKENEFVEIAFPSTVGIRDAFSLAATKTAPFNSKGNNFRDAVIWFSVAEFVSRPGVDLIFVTDDPKFAELCRGISPKSISIRSYSDAVTDLQQKISKVESQRLERLKTEVLRLQGNVISETMLEGLRELEFGPSITFSEALASVDDVVLVSKPEILSIFGETQEGLRFTARAKGELAYTVFSVGPAFMAQDYRLTYSQMMTAVPEAITDPMFSPPPKATRKQQFNVTAQFSIRRIGDGFGDVVLIEIEHDCKPTGGLYGLRDQTVWAGEMPTWGQQKP
jgi:hypothetical protein